MFEDEIPRYKKRKNKSPPRKANHKHTEERCLYIFPMPTFDKQHGMVNEDRLSPGAYCPICGKVMWTASVVEWAMGISDIPEQELRSLPRFRLKDIWQNYIEEDGSWQ